MKEKTKRATNKEETLDNALQRRRCNAVLLCEGVKGRKEIGHLLGENTNDKVDKLGKLLVAQRVQLLDVAVQLLVWGRSTASEVKLWHPEDGKERRKEEDRRKKAFSHSSKTTTEKRRKEKTRRKKTKKEPTMTSQNDITQFTFRIRVFPHLLSSPLRGR